ncbi:MULTISPECIES: hypothetical protein [Burkholderia]|uniref:hypothetical protein n=1 Tax=Burkholderia TaxID=32008 RepID=UPI0012E35A33|nr:MULTISPECIES: hypothetical protein [Burkholderia]
MTMDIGSARFDRFKQDERRRSNARRVDEDTRPRSASGDRNLPRRRTGGAFKRTLRAIRRSREPTITRTYDSRTHERRRATTNQPQRMPRNRIARDPRRVRSQQAR